MHTVTFQYEPLTWPASHSTKSGSLPQSPSMLPSLCSRTVCDLDVLAGSRPAPPRSSSNPPQLHPRTPRVSSSLPCCPRPQQSFFFFFFPAVSFSELPWWIIIEGGPVKGKYALLLSCCFWLHCAQMWKELFLHSYSKTWDTTVLCFLQVCGHSCSP